MDRIDALGSNYNNFNILTKNLLAETNDEDLQNIVQQAASDLNSPIALVSLVLDQTQFFKAHVGLPDVLVATRGTHRDASFCQFVVRDGQPFEVNDGETDSRIPQHVVKEFNIQAYLGMPVKVEETVVGSLCVLDTKKRKFTQQEYQQLQGLAQLVSKRLNELVQMRRQAQLSLTYNALQPALAELSDALTPIQEHLNSSFAHLSSIRLFLNYYQHKYQLSDHIKLSTIAGMSFDAARKSNELLQDYVEEVEMSILDVSDYLTALRQLVDNARYDRISEVVTTAQDIARHVTKTVGGFKLPDFLSDPIILIKGDLARALVSNCLLALAGELSKKEHKKGIEVEVEEQGDWVYLLFSAKGLKKNILTQVADQINLLIGSQQLSVFMVAEDKHIKLAFKTVAEA